MNAVENKHLLQNVFAELSTRNTQPLLEMMADDFCWTIIGTTEWSGTYRGKQNVLNELLQPLVANFETHYTNTAHRFIAEDDFVVVESRGNVTTKKGKPYHNTYCFICRLTDGKLQEITEYSDTQLIATVLEK